MPYAGLTHGQEKLGKTKKNDKSQVKMGVFGKSQEIFFLNIRFFSSNLPSSLYFKASN